MQEGGANRGRVNGSAEGVVVSRGDGAIDNNQALHTLVVTDPEISPGLRARSQDDTLVSIVSKTTHYLIGLTNTPIGSCWYRRRRCQ